MNIFYYITYIICIIWFFWTLIPHIKLWSHVRKNYMTHEKNLFLRNYKTKWNMGLALFVNKHPEDKIYTKLVKQNRINWIVLIMLFALIFVFQPKL
jgi:hypothetical protein